MLCLAPKPRPFPLHCNTWFLRSFLDIQTPFLTFALLPPPTHNLASFPRFTVPMCYFFLHCWTFCLKPFTSFFSTCPDSGLAIGACPPMALLGLPGPLCLLSSCIPVRCKLDILHLNHTHLASVCAVPGTRTGI